MKPFLAVLALSLGLVSAAQAQTAQSVDGDWTGVVHTGALDLRIVLHLGQTVTFDSPDQNATGLPGSMTREGARVFIESPPLQARFNLDLSADGGSLTGALVQGGATMPAEFHRGAAPARH